ncbi:hypothetical protein THAOC_24081, partial [Thalassiosira oceanica]
LGSVGLRWVLCKGHGEGQTRQRGRDPRVLRRVTVERQHATSISVTLTLVESIVRGEKLDMLAHERQMKETRKSERYVRAMDEESLVVQLGQKKPSLKNKLVRASNSGTWLSEIPNNLCDNILSAVEFRDNIRLRYGLVPLNLEPFCDGCGKRADVEHYLSCPVGGLRNLRHDQLGRMFATHAKDALSKAYVRREPRTIPSAVNKDKTGTPMLQEQTQPPLKPEDVKTERVATCQSTASGIQVPIVCLTFASLIPRPNPIGRKTLERFLKPRRRRRKTSILGNVWRGGSTSPPWFSLSTAWQEKKPRRIN